MTEQPLTEQPLKVLLVTATFDPLIGGAETYALTLANGLARRRHEVTVVTDGTHKAAALREVVETGEHTYRVLRLTRYWQAFEREGAIPWEVLAFGLLPELEHELANTPIDIIVTNSLDTALLGKTIALHYDVPWVATFHEQAPQNAPFGRGTLRLVYNVLEPDAILVGSGLYANRAREWGGNSTTVHVPHGIDTELFQPTDGSPRRAELGAPPGVPVIAFGGRLTPRKGIPDLLASCAQLAMAHPDLRVVIAGTVNSSDRSYANSLRDCVQQFGLESSVVFDEEVRQSGMPAVFCAADVIVQPSHAEGLGLAVLEAMSCGRPVVTTDIDATSEIAMDADVLVRCPVGDTEALAYAISALLDDERRRIELGVRARAHVLKHFSQDAMITATEAALRNVLSRLTAEIAR